MVASDSMDVEEAIHSSSPQRLQALALDPCLSEELALGLLKRPDLAPQIVVAVSQNSSVSEKRKVRLAIVAHSHTPRYLSLPMLRLLYTFDLIEVALTPHLAGDIKRAAEQALLGRLETVSLGEKLTLARRASGRIAASLLLEQDVRVIDRALDNPRLTEISLRKAILARPRSSALVESVCQHPKWSHAREVRIALLCCHGAVEIET